MQLFTKVPFLAWLTMLTLLLSPQAWAARPLAFPDEGAPIAEVTVTGIDRIEQENVLRRMELREGAAFSRAAYRRDLKAIASIEGVEPLKTSIIWEENPDGTLVLTVEIVETPTIGSIQVVGNSKFSEDEIIQELGFKSGDLASRQLRSSTVRNIRSFYRNGGYKAAEVEVRLLEGDQEGENIVDVVIYIDEGERIRIKDVIFEGNSHFNSPLLQLRLLNSPGILFFNNYFDESLVEDDLAALRSMYRDAGYLDASVKAGDFIYDEEEQEITIVYDIEEGPRYEVNRVYTEGITLFTQKEVEDATNRMTERTYKGKRLRRSLDELQRLYGDEGYIDTEIRYRLEKDREKQLVDIVVVVDEKPVVYVGEVRLMMEDYDYDVDFNWLEKSINKLNPPTKEETIQKEIRLEPGAKYRTSDEVRTVERIKNLGIFREVEVARQNTTDPQVRDAAVYLEEDPAAAFFGVTAGVGEESGPSVTFLFEHPNVGGRADKFGASATFGTRNTAFRIRYFDRYVGDSQTSMDYRLYWAQSRYRVYTERTIGGSVEAGRPLSEYWKGYMRFRLERVNYPRHTDDAEEDFDDYYVAAVRPMIVYDIRDNENYPTRGALASGGFETGAADGFLLRFLHAFEWYKKPFDKRDEVYFYGHTVGLMPYDATSIGLGERYFVGGTSSLRGFRVREVGPRDPENDDLAIGGATRITQRHEFRFPIAEEFLIGRVFTDAAILEQGPLELGPPRVGSGIGAMIDLGPITAELDFAVPVLKEEHDRRQFIHLRLGSKF